MGYDWNMDILKVNKNKELCYLELAKPIDISLLNGLYFHQIELKEVKAKVLGDKQTSDTLVVKNLSKKIDRKRLEQRIADLQPEAVIRYQDTKLDKDFAFVDANSNPELISVITDYRDEAQTEALVIEANNIKELPSQNTLHVTNLPFSCDEAQLQSTLEHEGLEPLKVKIIKDWRTGKSKGYAYVDVAEPLGKELKISIEGRQVEVTNARERYENKRQKKAEEKSNAGFKALLGL